MNSPQNTQNTRKRRPRMTRMDENMKIQHLPAIVQTASAQLALPAGGPNE